MDTLYLSLQKKDKIFTPKFWKELNKLSDTKLNFSSTYHPQTDDRSKVVNKCLKGYFRAMVHDNPKKWLSNLP